MTREFLEKGVGDFASVSWGFGQRVLAVIGDDLNAATEAALDVYISGEHVFHVSTRDNLEAVTIELPRDVGDYSGVRIEIPELVLGDPHLLISEDATPEEMKALMSDACAGVDGGGSVRARVCEYFGELVLEVELPGALVFIFSVCEGSSKTLALRIGHDARCCEESKGQVIYVEVPNGVFGDIREKDQPQWQADD
jgi:hypothetical protein